MHLGLDLGTSGLKALVVDADQHVVAMATAPLEVSRPHAGWSEQRPEDWVRACEALFARLAEHLPQVQSIGIAGHMHGVVLLDDSAKAVRPCLLWNDTRAADLAAQMDANPLFRQISGNIVFPGFSAPKMAWVRDNEPQVWAASKTMLFPKDYLAFWLTGNMRCEPSDAAGSALFDCARGQWSDQLCHAAGIDPAMLAPILASDGSRGCVRAQVASRFGLPSDCVVAGGAGDNAAAALGIGSVKQGQGQVSLGTSGVLLTVNERWSPSAQTAVHSFNHAAAGCFIQMGVTLTATDSLSWLADIVGHTPAGLASELPAKSDGPGELLFLPYLAGERTPHNLDRAMGGFLGLSRNHGPAEMTQAVMEGVAYSIADCASALRDAGASVEQLTAVGGGAKSSFWLQTLADVLERPLALNPNAEHAAALGAARLGMAAQAGCGVAELADSLRQAKSHGGEVIDPRPNLFDRYRDALSRYRHMFNALKGV